MRVFADGIGPFSAAAFQFRQGPWRSAVVEFVQLQQHKDLRVEILVLFQLLCGGIPLVFEIRVQEFLLRIGTNTTPIAPFKDQLAAGL